MKKLGYIWILSLFLKLLISALVPLSADEAYYWVWSHHLQLSYFDHPPMVAWLFKLGHFLEPYLNAVRWPAVLLGHCTLGIGVVLLRNILSLEQVTWWIYLVLLSPLLGFGSLIITPDLPVVFFWVLSLYFTQRIFSQQRWYDYSFLGASLGLGFCAKYHIVLFLPCLILYVFKKKLWKEVKPTFLLLTIFFGLLFSSPVLIWNYANDFASFKFQLKHGLQDEGYDYNWTLAYTLGQILIITPWALLANFRKNQNKQLTLFKFFAWTPLVFFFATSFRASVEANWPIIALPGIYVLAASDEKIESWFKYFAIYCCSLLLLILSAQVIPEFRKVNEKISEPYLMEELSKLAKEYSPLYAPNYQIASSVWYFSKTPIYKIRGMSRFDFFDTLSNSQPNEKHFFFIKYARVNMPDWLNEPEWNQKEIKTINSEITLVEFTHK